MGIWRDLPRKKKPFKAWRLYFRCGGEPYRRVAFEYGAVGVRRVARRGCRRVRRGRAVRGRSVWVRGEMPRGRFRSLPSRVIEL
jgi:hypothetical protein